MRPLAVIVLSVLVVVGCRKDYPDRGSDSGSASGSGSGSGSAPASAFACPMHPEVAGQGPVPCSKCGMSLASRGGGGVFICPEHAGAGELGSLAEAARRCGACGRPLVPAPVILVHDCPRHDGFFRDGEGACPICGSALLAETAAVTWRCPAHPRPLLLEKGPCRRCGAALERLLLAPPHGDHNPKHGGTFFMAGDRWHHLEGTLPEKGLFRLYLYDEFTRPLRTSGLDGSIEARIGGGIEGRIEVLRRPGEEAEAGPRVLPLAPGRTGDVLEARGAELEPPVEIALFLSLPDPGRPAGAASPGPRPPERFDFRFERLTAPSEEPPGAEAALAPPLEAPADPLAAADEIGSRVRRIEELLSGRALADVHRPALEAKDIVLSLEGRPGAVPKERRGAFERGAAKVVRGAWLIDFHGDRGDGAATQRAFQLFREGVAEVVGALRG